MAENSKIEWTATVRPDGTVVPGYTFNPWRGCTKVSAGCAHCYAETLSGRNPATLGVWGPNGTRVVAAELQWREPLKWNKASACDCFARADLGERHIPKTPHTNGCPQAERPRVFCASLADVFEEWTGPMTDVRGGTWSTAQAGHWWNYQHETTDDDWGVRDLTMQDVRARLFALIDATPNLDWLLLTKRPENIARMMPRVGFPDAGVPGTLGRYLVPPNVWLGTSVENQAAADERIPHLLRTPAAVRFLSCEPLLGPVRLDAVMGTHQDGTPFTAERPAMCSRPHTFDARFRSLHWVIVGGESGHGARPCDIAWLRSLVAQCKAASVPVFVKQFGSNATANYYDEFREEWESNRGNDWPESLDWNHRDGQPPLTARVALPLANKGGDPAEWPADLRVREFPEVRHAS